MSMRITQRMMMEHSLFALQEGLGRLSESQEHLSTGRLINRPSDSPTGTNEAMRLRSQISAGEQYVRNSQDGLSWLGTTDQTLTSMLDVVRRARGLIVQGLSTGSNGPDARTALGVELGQLRSSLLSLANTQHLGRPIFGGTTAGGTAYDAGGAFVGTQAAVNRTIDDGESVAVNVSGPAAFASGATNLFAVVGDAATQVVADPTALNATLQTLDDITEQMTSALADVGARYARVENTIDRLQGTAIDQHAALSNVENVDIAKAVVDLKLQEVAYQGSLGATARVLQPSLLDFLR
ncbi:MAG TPA: flagellar hook-associated protein FlgL [Nocardioidaceae bacterium]|nr:flagellar hook-associated protein FlgL [Nocardioidaceae bacterium]